MHILFQQDVYNKIILKNCCSEAYCYPVQDIDGTANNLVFYRNVVSTQNILVHDFLPNMFSFCKKKTRSQICL